jgi:hypothetical protein
MKNLTAKPFKNGDRVVPSIKLWKRLEARSCTGIGSQDNPTAWFFNGEFVALGDVCYSIDKNGRLNRVDEQDLYFLHAPTFGHLKKGDDNPFVVGQDVKIDGSNGTVVEAETGPRIYVDQGRSANWYGWSPSGEKYPREDINTIFPATQEQPAHAAGFEFGDTVKVEGRRKKQYVAATIPGFVLIYNKSEFEKIKQGEGCMAFAASLSRVSPWPEPEPVKLNHEYEATVYPEHIKVGCQEISFEAFDHLAAAVAKVREA